MGKLKTVWKIIDVSEHNGKIDWNRVKATDIKGAIIRCGFGTEGIDKTYEYNANECIRLGIPFGFYHYSYMGWEMEGITDENKRLALVIEQGRDEAKHFWKLIAPYEHLMTFPACIDVEEKCSLALSPKELHYGIKTYADYLQARNILVGIYASQNPMETKLNWYDKNNPQESSVLGYLSLWCAKWDKNDATQTPEDYPRLKISAIKDFTIKPEIWQYSSNGTVDGINGRVDVNYCYIDYPTLLEESGLNGAWAKGIDMKPNERGLIDIHGKNDVTRYFQIPNPFKIFRNEDGSIYRGIKKIGEDSYCFLENLGIMCNGERNINGEFYLFRFDNGKMLSSQWYKYKDDNGNVVEKFYLPNGTMARFSKYKINGKDYVFTPVGTTVPQEQAPFIQWSEEYGDKDIIVTKETYDRTVIPEEPIEPPVEPEVPTEPDTPVDPPIDPVEPPTEPDIPVTPPVEPSEPTRPDVDDNTIVALLKSIIALIVDLLKKLFKK